MCVCFSLLLTSGLGQCVFFCRGRAGYRLILVLFLICHFSRSVMVDDVRCTVYSVCSGVALTAEPACRAGVVSILMSMYL